MHMKRKSWTYPLNDLKNIEFVYFVNLVSPLEEDGLLRTPGWVVPTEAASSGDVLVCWWRLGEGSPQKREQALEGLTVPFWRPTASTADLQFFPHGCLSGQHQHASWFEGPIKVRGAIVSWGSQSYCFESWNSESCVIDSLSQQDLSCPLIQPFFGLEGVCIPIALSGHRPLLHLLLPGRGWGAPSWGFQAHVCVNSKPRTVCVSLKSLSQELSFVSSSSALWAPPKKVLFLFYDPLMFEEKFYISLESSFFTGKHP